MNRHEQYSNVGAGERSREFCLTSKGIRRDFDWNVRVVIRIDDQSLRIVRFTFEVFPRKTVFHGDPNCVQGECAVVIVNLPDIAVVASITSFPIGVMVAPDAPVGSFALIEKRRDDAALIAGNTTSRSWREIRAQCLSFFDLMDAPQASTSASIWGQRCRKARRMPSCVFESTFGGSSLTLEWAFQVYGNGVRFARNAGL